MSRFLGCKRASAWAAVYGAVCADIRRQAMSEGRQMTDELWSDITSKARIAADRAQNASDAHEARRASNGEPERQI
jgi:hypothetical protein